jgi:threonine/homoserine efflux transporter RhtA
VGFSAYLWLLRNVRTTLVSTYAYVNPIVAVTLGVVVLDEALTGRIFLSGAIVLASVALIVSSGSAARQPEDAGDPAAGVAREMAEEHGESAPSPTGRPEH